MRYLAPLIAFIGLAVGLDACIRTINARETNGGFPLVHAQYQQDNSAKVVFTSSTTIQRMCANSKAVACMLTLGGEKVIYAPNPCGFTDGYARILCHELKHVNGMPKEAAAPKHGFVCVPAITPHMGPVRTREWT